MIEKLSFLFKKYPFIYGVFASFISAAFFGALFLYQPPILEMVQEDLWDAFYPLAEKYDKKNVSPNLVVVRFDEKSLNELKGEIDVELWRSTIQRLTGIARVVAIDCGLGEKNINFILEKPPKNLVLPVFGSQAEKKGKDVVAKNWKPLCLNPALNPLLKFAHTVFLVDEDGVVRRVPMFVTANGERLNALSFEAVKLFRGNNIQLSESPVVTSFI